MNQIRQLHQLFTNDQGETRLKDVAVSIAIFLSDLSPLNDIDKERSCHAVMDLIAHILGAGPAVHLGREEAMARMWNGLLSVPTYNLAPDKVLEGYLRAASAIGEIPHDEEYNAWFDQIFKQFKDKMPPEPEMNVV